MKLILVLVIVLAGSGCATTTGHNAGGYFAAPTNRSSTGYTGYEARRQAAVVTGTVLAVRDVRIEGDPSARASSAAMGGTLGGMLGSKVGQGNGRIAAILVGAGLGARTGARAAARGEPAQEVVVKRDDGRTVVITQAAAGSEPLQTGDAVFISELSGVSRVARRSW